MKYWALPRVPRLWLLEKYTSYVFAKNVLWDSAVHQLNIPRQFVLPLCDPFSKIKPECQESIKLYRMCEDISQKMGYEFPKGRNYLCYGDIDYTMMGAYTYRKGGRIVMFPGFVLSGSTLPSYLSVDIDKNDRVSRQNWVEGYENYLIQKYPPWSPKKMFRSKVEVDLRRALYSNMLDYYQNPVLYDQVREGILAHEICHLKYKDTFITPSITLTMSMLNIMLSPYPLTGIIPIYLIDKMMSRMKETRCDMKAIDVVGKIGLERFLSDFYSRQREIIQKYPEINSTSTFRNKIILLTANHPPTTERCNRITQS